MPSTKNVGQNMFQMFRNNMKFLTQIQARKFGIIIIIIIQTLSHIQLQNI